MQRVYSGTRHMMLSRDDHFYSCKKEPFRCFTLSERLLSFRDWLRAVNLSWFQHVNSGIWYFPALPAASLPDFYLNLVI